MRPLRVLTWHVHGSYLYYLCHCHQTIYVPVKPGRPDGYAGRTPSYPWPENLVEIPAEEVKTSDFDVVLFQSHRNYLEDQYELLSPAQRRLPRIYLEHDPPRHSPTDTKHPVDDPDCLLVHVTAFNNLMWDNNRTPSCVIDHGVTVPDGVRYTGELDRGIVVVNNIAKRGRRLGFDLFQRAKSELPLDLVGMGWQQAGGIGEVPHRDLPAFASRYRFFFNPIRYTSLGLAILEAMMTGLPVLGLATAELVTVIRNGDSGYLETDLDRLLAHMRRLLHDPDEARALGEGARRVALERFNIRRFARDWDAAFTRVAGPRPDAFVSVPQPVAFGG
jgi:glycosyltransferase involved in cell wall biosynthesis